MESGKLPPTALEGVMSYLHKVLGGLTRLYELCLINFTQLREAGRTVQTIDPCGTDEETEAGLVVKVREAEPGFISSANAP